MDVVILRVREVEHTAHAHLHHAGVHVDARYYSATMVLICKAVGACW